MRTTKLFLPFLLFCCISTLAQQVGIVVKYEETFNPERALKTAQGNMTPDEILKLYLNYKSDKYLYCNNAVVAFGTNVINNRTKTIDLRSDLSANYRSLTDNVQIDVYGVCSSKFVIVDSVFDYQWDISPDAIRVVMGKQCQKAVFHSPDRLEGDVVAWFCPELPFQAGPLGYCGLPGLILRLETRNFFYEAVSVEPITTTPKIKLPQSGQKVSRTEFYESRIRILKEMNIDGAKII